MNRKAVNEGHVLLRLLCNVCGRCGRAWKGVWGFGITWLYFEAAQAILFTILYIEAKKKKEASRLRIMMLQSGMRDGENENDGFHGYYDDCSQPLVIL